MLTNIQKLFRDPFTNLRKVIPYTKRNANRILRNLMEPLGIDILSKPYPGYEKLKEFISFRQGFFVEVGANDGYFQDPTYYYEKIIGWKGILVEPLPYLYQACCKNRAGATVFNYACVPSSFKNKEVTIIDNNAMSFIKDGINNQKEWIEKAQNISGEKFKEATVKARTLDDILAEYKAINEMDSKEIIQIDLLVIDVEGYELEVLKGLDFKKHRPKFILLECHQEMLLKKIDKYLAGKYEMISFVPTFDYLYVQI